MLTILLGTDWVANRDTILSMLAKDVKEEKGGRIWMVPELISHDAERRLCKAASDTASRFAEVLSFSRLHRRVCDTVGHGARECLDNGGRVVAMAAAARQLHSKLKAYAAMETRPEFLIGLLDAVDDFKRCCITPEDLMRASQRTEGSLAQKLEELSLLLETYNALCAQGKRDPSDQMTWLLEQLEDSDFAQNHVFYIDGFPDFTRQHMAIIEHIASNAPKVVISLTCDDPVTANPAFETTANTVRELLAIARKNNIPYEIQTVSPRKGDLEEVRSKLFQGDIRKDTTYSFIHANQFDTVYEECMFAAERIMELVRRGARYRDIGIVCADMGAYKNTLHMILQRCHIPVYISGTENILDKTVISTVLSAIDAALGGFEYADMIRYMKSILSPLEICVCDQIEEYAYIWSVSGNRWLTAWTNHPDGLSAEWTDQTQEKLDALNAAREMLIRPLENLRLAFRNARSVSDQVAAVYGFLEEVKFSERLSILADEMDLAGDNRNAQILDQLWEILLGALEQMHDILGQTAWDAENFTKLLRLLLSRYDVGTIPPVLDSVAAGPVSAMRCTQVKHLMVLGALEGCLPGYPGSTGVLTDQERSSLRKLGVPLTGGAMEGVQAEFAEIYGVFSGAEETISVSCPAGQPSFIYNRLLQMSGSKDICYGIAPAVADPVEAGAFFARWQDEKNADQLGVCDTYREILARVEHCLGSISDENVRKLYGKKLNLSASQVDCLADCRLSYFLKYGLRIQHKKPAVVDPAEFGSYVHAVLEQTARKVMESGGFREVTREQILSFSEQFSQEYVREHFSQIDSQRLIYLFKRNMQELELVVCELWEELKESEFAPVAFELAFGDGAEMDAIPICGRKIDAQLRGFVDRVDLWETESGANYYRVVDYKTGRKDFDYCDVFNGYGLQMLLYLFALEDKQLTSYQKESLPAGVQYFPARVPYLSADGMLSQDQLQQLRAKNWKRKGLLLKDEQVLAAMEPGDKPVRMNYLRRKDGLLSGDLADTEQLKLLKRYVFRLLGNMVDDIASGCVEPNPYTRGASHNACTFCPFGAVCHPDQVEGRRNYKTMGADRFWEEVGKEVKEDG